MAYSRHPLAAGGSDSPCRTYSYHIPDPADHGRQRHGEQCPAPSATRACQATPDVASDQVKTFVKGIFSIDGRMISLIELDHILPHIEAEAA